MIKQQESTKGFVKELKEEAKIAGQIADQRAKADKVERKLIVERAEADRKVAELREKAALIKIAGFCKRKNRSIRRSR